MKFSHTLTCFFVLTLRHGFINSEVLVWRATEGENITVLCTFTLSGRQRTFCKDDCEGENILIQTDQDTAQRGRYSMKYQEGTFPLSSTLLFVSITHLTISDSGRYKCSLTRIISTSSQQVEIRVDAPVTSKPTSVPPASITTTPSSGSGGSSPSSASSEATKQSQQQQEDNESTPAAVSGMLRYVCLTLGVMIVALSAAVLIFCRKRASKPKDAPVQADYANITEVSREYEEIREDGWSRSPPVQISTVYTCTSYSKANSETTDKVSFATADSSQKKTEDISSKLTYSELDFSNSAAASSNSAPRGDAVNVVYSVPRVDASPPLYSTLTLV